MQKKKSPHPSTSNEITQSLRIPSGNTLTGPMLLEGNLANIYFNALTFAQLRRHPEYQGLPPAESVLTIGRPSYRYVRQDDPQWDRLHRGILTTGRLAAALGLHEPSAAAALGRGTSFRQTGRSRLLDAWEHLCGEHYVPVTNPHVTPEAAEAHNRVVTTAFNAASVKGVWWAEGEESDGSAGGAWGGDETPALQHTAAPMAELLSSVPGLGAGGGNSGSVGPTARKWVEQENSGRLVAPFARPLSTASSSPQLSSAPAAAAPFNPLAVPEDAKLKKARSLGSRGLDAVRMSWGSAQEASSLFSLISIFPGSQLREVGLCALDASDLPSDWGFEPGSLPPMGASPDGMIRHPLLRGGGVSGAGCGGGGSRKDRASGQDNGFYAEAECEDDARGRETGVLLSRVGLPAPLRALDPSIAPDEWWEEVVEVKNTCPFGSPNPRRHRGGRRLYILSDRGPRDIIPPEWVPQLQWHMLCSGAPSALLASRSATRGMRLYRMARDDSYLVLALSVVSWLWTRHVLPRQAPASDALLACPEHAAMVAATRRLATTARLVGETEAGAEVPGGDRRLFLD
jgi:hypothetical protein